MSEGKIAAAVEAGADAAVLKEAAKPADAALLAKSLRDRLRI
jgi:hypothetical protein